MEPSLPFSPLNQRQRAVIEALAPSGAHPLLDRGALELGFEQFYEGFRREAKPSLRAGFALALWACAWLAPLLIGRLPPITRLAAAERERALEALFSHRLYLLRQLGLIVKAVVSFSYGSHPGVRDAIGYPRQFDGGLGSGLP